MDVKKAVLLSALFGGEGMLRYTYSNNNIMIIILWLSESRKELQGGGRVWWYYYFVTSLNRAKMKLSLDHKAYPLSIMILNWIQFMWHTLGLAPKQSYMNRIPLLKIKTCTFQKA